MKRIIFCLCLVLSGSSGLQAQERFAPDQNPRYKEGLNRYIKLTDSLTKNQGTTLQQTYKAYDWYEAKLERRQQRRYWRQHSCFYPHNSWYGPGFYYPNYFYRPYYWNTSSIWFNYRWNLGDRYRYRH